MSRMPGCVRCSVWFRREMTSKNTCKSQALTRCQGVEHCCLAVSVSRKFLQPLHRQSLHQLPHWAEGLHESKNLQKHRAKAALSWLRLKRLVPFVLTNPPWCASGDMPMLHLLKVHAASGFHQSCQVPQHLWNANVLLLNEMQMSCQTPRKSCKPHQFLNHK